MQCNAVSYPNTRLLGTLFFVTIQSISVKRLQTVSPDGVGNIHYTRIYIVWWMHTNAACFNVLATHLIRTIFFVIVCLNLNVCFLQFNVRLEIGHINRI